MAFTVAHMAAALPFYHSRRWLCFEALLIGTMLPDLPYFLSSSFLNNSIADAHQSHQWAGVLSYCLPWGLLVFVLWYWLLKPAAIALEQPWCHVQPLTQQRTVRYVFRVRLFTKLISKLKFWLFFWLKVTLGLCLGSATHLVWDGITHVDGFIAQQVWWLQYSVSVKYLGAMTVARFLQYLSSMVGLLLLFRFARSSFKSRCGAKPQLDMPAVTTLDLSVQSLLVKKRHSMLIISLIGFSSLLWASRAALKRHNLLINDTYSFLAQSLVSLLQCAVGLFIVYAIAYQLIYRMLGLLHHKNY